jgi:hypothetical protein
LRLAEILLISGRLAVHSYYHYQKIRRVFLIRGIRLTLVVSCLIAGLAPAGAAGLRDQGCGPASYVGRPLAEALEELRACGLSLIYSSDRVRPRMRVEAEPTGASTRQILDALLAAHGLAAIDGPGGRILIVSADAAAAATGGLKGRILADPGDIPIPHARVRLAGFPLETVTSRDGSFRFEKIPQGIHTIEVFRGQTLLDRFDAVRVEPEKISQIDLEVSISSSFIEQVTVTPSRYKIAEDEPELRRRVLNETLQQTPNIGGDVNRALSHLPGLASGDRSAQFSIRGGTPSEVLFVLDGLEILDPFHLKAFQSFSGIVDSRAIGRADILTGSFPAEYGDTLSGVVDLSSASPSGNGQTLLGTNFHNSHFLSDGRLGSGGGQWLLSARAWYPDVINELVAPTGEEIGPAYQDFLGKVQVHVGDSSTLSGNLLMSHDTADYKEEEIDSNEEVTARSNSEYAWVSLESAWNSRLFSSTHLSVGRIRGDRRGSTEEDSESAITVRDERSFDVYGLKQDWGYRATESAFFKFGIEAKRIKGTYDYFADIPGGTSAVGLDAPTASTQRTVFIEPTGDELAAFVSGRFKLFDPLTVELGARWDQQSHTSEDQLSPRVNVLYTLGSRSAIRAGWGRFYQSQGIHELRVEDGISDFFPAQLAEHRVISFEHNFANGLHLRLNAYSKEISNPIPRFENLFDPIELFPEAEPDRVQINADRAEARGIELFLKSPPGKRVSWWAGYARSSSEDEIEGDTVPRTWDQKHALNFGLNYRPTPRWTFDLAGIYHSGWPTTGVRAETAELADGSLAIQPILGPRNGERFSDYHRLDLRISRHVPLDRGRLTFYVEVLNLYDQQNTCCVDDFEFTPRPDGSVRVDAEEAYWLGRVPNLGIVWELRR